MNDIVKIIETLDNKILEPNGRVDETTLWQFRLEFTRLYYQYERGNTGGCACGYNTYDETITDQDDYYYSAPTTAG